MNNTAVQTATQPVMIGRALFGGQGAGTGEMNGDFMALILQLLGTPMDGEGSGLFAPSQDMGQSEETDETDPNQLAMQMMAELFNTNATLADTFAVQTDESISQLRAAMGTTQNPALQQLLAALEEKSANAEKAAGKSALSDAQLLQGGEKDGKTDAQSVEQLIASVQSGGDSKGGAQSETSLLGGQSRFQSAVMAAQKLMKSERKVQPETEVGAIDVDKLQQAVDAARFNSTGAVPKQAAQLDARDLAEQLKSGASESLAKGKSEFVVKLKPEGLGEITVKLIESGGRTTLSLISASEQTTKLLTGQLAALRETMRPYHVEVHEIVTQSENASSNLAQNGQFSQSFAEHQHRGFEQSRSSFAGQRANEADDAAIAQAGGVLPTSELDTYI